MHLTSKAATLALLLSVSAREATAQPPSETVGYIALIHTPAGLVALPSSLFDGTSTRGVSIGAAYSHLPRSVRNNATDAYALTGTFHLDAATHIAVTAGEYKGTCPDPECSWKLMLGAAVAREVASFDRLRVSAEADAGGGAEEFGTSYLTGRIAMPLSLTVTLGDKLRLVPHVSPGFGYARVSVRGTGAGTYTGSRFVVDGGLALAARDFPVRLEVGMVHILISNGSTARGVALSVSM